MKLRLNADAFGFKVVERAFAKNVRPNILGLVGVGDVYRPPLIGFRDHFRKGQ